MALVEVRAAGVAYDRLAMRQVQVVEFASVTKTYGCAHIPARKFVSIALFGRAVVRAECQSSKLAVEERRASGREMCVSA